MTLAGVCAPVAVAGEEHRGGGQRTGLHSSLSCMAQSLNRMAVCTGWGRSRAGAWSGRRAECICAHITTCHQLCAVTGIAGRASAGGGSRRTACNQRTAAARSLRAPRGDHRRRPPRSVNACNGRLLLREPTPLWKEDGAWQAACGRARWAAQSVHGSVVNSASVDIPACFSSKDC